ncbi:hypothetical protein FH972_017121 [Carpinus fangiana]|uniref:Uncharacterized protein n=1 Tax=Carpinus fangiana TaxID=176857 RepID=A0A5N6RLB6_9ROSI|nr:hypothetical protein FH972_017121 [Carpinus fangiana]
MSMICSLSISFCISAVSGQCLNDQRALLLQLKNSLVFDNASSTKLVHWNQSVDCCSWEGVSCNEGLVIGLDLNNEAILGGLDNSSSLFGLRYLQHLNLAYNYYLEQIPSQFDKLTNLSYLNLSHAGFWGQIPVAISHLTRLVTLDLSHNYLGSSYGSLKLESPNLNMLVQNLSELTELYLGSVNISTQGHEWGPALSSLLPKLRVLSLTNCYLSGPHDSLLLMVHNFSELIELYVDGVNMSMQGYEWGPALSSSLPKLKVLSMSNCYISGPFDSSLTNLQSLSIIRLDSNNFSSPVSEFFANFKNLMSLDFSFSSLNGKFPEKIFQISTLQTLYLSSNELLHGSLPEFPLNGSLQILFLEGTNFSGILPHSIGNLKMLSEIHIPGCNFNGSIPKSMASLTKLVYLDMSNNNFDGSIPSFSMSKNLTTIDLSNNVLTGQITFTRWEELLNLEVLDLSNNSLEGNIPISLFSLPSLSLLALSNNRFSGQLTEFSIVSSDRLRCVDLNNNNLEGPIPMSIFELRGLDTLLLSWNNFSGSLQLNVIPTMRELIFLDLSHNSLDSSKLKTFPHFLRNESALSNLDLSDNQLDGEIPNWIWELPYLNFLNLSYNYLETLDFHLLNMSFASSIDLRSNQLQGQLSVFPKAAQYLDFSMNNFSSVIPVSIGFPSFLLLSRNKLYGRPNASWPMLQIVDIASNNFTGMLPIKHLSNWKAIADDRSDARSQLNHLHFEGDLWDGHVMVEVKQDNSCCHTCHGYKVSSSVDFYF